MLFSFLGEVFKGSRDAVRLQKKIDKCDWTNSQEISKLFSEVFKKFFDSRVDIPENIFESLVNLLDRAQSIDKDLMKKIIEFNAEDRFGYDFNPEEFLNKCDFDDELIYDCIMEWYYEKLVGIVDENKLEEQRKNAIKDIKQYFYRFGFKWDPSFDDYHFSPDFILEHFGSKWDLDVDFLRYVANNMNIFDIDRKYFKWMTDDEFDAVILEAVWEDWWTYQKSFDWNRFEKMPNEFAKNLIASWYSQTVMDHLDKFEITDELESWFFEYYDYFDSDRGDFREFVEKLSNSLWKKFNKSLVSTIISYWGEKGSFLLIHTLENFEWLDYESAKEIAETGNLHLLKIRQYFDVTDEQWKKLESLSEIVERHDRKRLEEEQKLRKIDQREEKEIRKEERKMEEKERRDKIERERRDEEDW